MNEIEIKKCYKHSGNRNATAIIVASLADEIWREHYTPIIGAAQVDYMLAKFQSAEQIYKDIKDNEYVYFIAEQIEKTLSRDGSVIKSHEPIGYSAGQPKEDYMLLSKLYVRKNCRGKGIARSLLDEAFAFCRREYGFNKIRLTVNKNNDGSIAAYKKMGFETIDLVKTDIGGGFFMDDYVMELKFEV